MTMTRRFSAGSAYQLEGTSARGCRTQRSETGKNVSMRRCGLGAVISDAATYLKAYSDAAVCSALMAARYSSRRTTGSSSKRSGHFPSAWAFCQTFRASDAAPSRRSWFRSSAQSAAILCPYFFFTSSSVSPAPSRFAFSSTSIPWAVRWRTGVNNTLDVWYSSDRRSTSAPVKNRFAVASSFQ
ncbi:hypothetical protein SHLA_14c000520 [Shinella sp. DD12]|nr:hypothetical protein SHLA_14c000520 [Shinella sp. DD12]